MKMLKYIRCFKFDLKFNNNKVYNYIFESIACLPVPGGRFPSFLKALSFPSSTQDFHSLVWIIGGHSYLGFLSGWTLNWSLTIFICWPAFFSTSALLKVSLPNMTTKWLVRSSFKFFVCLSHLVQIVGPNISNERSFRCL